MLRNGLIVKVISITDTHVFGQTFLELLNYHTERIESTKVGVYQSSTLNSNRTSWPKALLETSAKKCMVVKLSTIYLIMPLIQQF